MSEPMRLTYFPVMAHGLAPALVCEMSGLPWVGPRDTGFTRESWPALKATGKCPFGQLPLLEVDGMNIGQMTAIVNYIGKKAGTEGTGFDFVMSQQLLAEAEDLYNSLQKFQPTWNVALGEQAKDGLSIKGTAEQYAKFWKEYVPTQLDKLNSLLAGKSRFTSTGRTVGEIVLWAILHQMKLCKPEMYDATPDLAKFYTEIEAEPGVQKVVSGKSSFGEWQTQYFVNPIKANL
mmetsp:Transcript_29806/g.48647  ORF Transcript_29806/g.48647 Transcript_29806/m.48647 type:complete len:233 (-) Transcript_29806:65-763(-)